MIGFHDYITNPRGGRPEPHPSWLAEQFITATTWVSAGASLVGAVYYYAKWQEANGTIPMLTAAILFATIAYVRHRALERKKTTLRAAIASHDKALAEVFG